MTNWGEVESVLARNVAALLADKLPRIGSTDWWRNHVLNQLTPSQATMADHLDDGELGGLDLAALLRIARQNWSELAYRFGLDRSGRELVERLMAARNRHAHRPVNGLLSFTVQDDVDAAAAFLRVIGADAASIERCVCLREELAAEAGGAASIPAVDRMIVPDGGPEQPSGSGATGSTERSVSSDGGWLIEPESHRNELAKALSSASYVGIDFGTSTSVVSIAGMDSDHRLTADTLKLAQPGRDGERIRNHLVSSVLAVVGGGRVLFGQDARALRPTLEEGRTVFSSFKMHLGVAVGPTYPQSRLRKGAGSVVIESAADATTEFLRCLRVEAEAAIASRGLPSETKFAISVPASFEANQRRALLGCARDAGLNVDSSCLIDEPNAAFLSFMNDCIHSEQDEELARLMKERGLSILVYDFGAGTCDVSILRMALPGGKVQSKNLAISKFAALGGDDIDRAIVKRILVPQLLRDNPEAEFTDTHVTRRLVPRLVPTAERLKIAANEWLTERGIGTLDALRSVRDEITDQPFRYTVRGKDAKREDVRDELTLERPCLSFVDLADVLRPFMGAFDDLQPGQHVFGPVDDALSKSGLTPYQLDAVLFIGGSAKSPLVRECVMRHLPDEVRAIVPQDLQSHVSTGAAMHSLGFHAFLFDFISPITSEPILVITRDGGLETIVAASASVPSERPFELQLTIDRDDQSTIELPICVSSEAKLLGLLRLDAPVRGHFARGARIDIKASVTADKLLVVEARTGDVRVLSSLLDPLANKELNHVERKLLEATQKYNQACLEGRGRPPYEDALVYAYAAQQAGSYTLAADLFCQLDASRKTIDHATSIGYCYGRAGRDNLAEKWGRIAYERRPSAVTAYNMYCRCAAGEEERFLREALRHDPTYDCALLALGSLLDARRDDEGRVLLGRAVRSLTAALDGGRIDTADCGRLATAARRLGDDHLGARAKARLDTLRGHDSSVFDNDKLADSLRPRSSMERY